MVINTLLALGAILSYIDVLSALQGSSLLFLQIVPIPPVHKITTTVNTFNIRGGSRTSTAGGGAQLTTEAEGFTDARSAERGRVGEGVTPSRRWGSGGLPRNFFEKLHQNGAF